MKMFVTDPLAEIYIQEEMRGGVLQDTPPQLRVFAVPHLGCAVCHYVLEIETEKAVV